MKDIAKTLADAVIQAIATQCPVSTGDRAREVAEAAILQVLGAQDDALEKIISESGGGWYDDEFRIHGGYLMDMLRKAAALRTALAGQGEAVAHDYELVIHEGGLVGLRGELKHPAGTKLYTHPAPAPSTSPAVAMPEGWQSRNDDLFISLELCSAELFAQCADQPRARKYIDGARKALAREQCFRASTGLAPSPVSAGEAVDACAFYDAGFRRAADWARRDDLLHDMESFAYRKDRDHDFAMLNAHPAPSAAPERAMQKLMARLSDLLDEDQFAECEAIVTAAGVEPPAPSAAPAWVPVPMLDSNELAALKRCVECWEDGEGHDVPKEMMARLADKGAVRHHSGRLFSVTTAGEAMLSAPPAPTASEGEK